MAWRDFRRFDYPQVVNVDGALGDGVTDNSDAFDAAIVNASNQTRPGVINVGAGVFKTTRPWHFSENRALTIKGAGGSAVQRRTRLYFTGAHAQGCLWLTSCYGLTFEDIEFVVANVSGSDQVVLLDADNIPALSCLQISFRNCEFRPFTGTTVAKASMLVKNSAMITFDRCRFNGAPIALQLGEDVGVDPGTFGNGAAHQTTLKHNVFYGDVVRRNCSTTIFDHNFFDLKFGTSPTQASIIDVAGDQLTRNETLIGNFAEPAAVSQTRTFYKQGSHVSSQGLQAQNNRIGDHAIAFDLVRGNAEIGTNDVTQNGAGDIFVRIGASAVEVEIGPNDYATLTAAGGTPVQDNRAVPDYGKPYLAKFNTGYVTARAGWGIVPSDSVNQQTKWQAMLDSATGDDAVVIEGVVRIVESQLDTQKRLIWKPGAWLKRHALSAFATRMLDVMPGAERSSLGDVFLDGNRTALGNDETGTAGAAGLYVGCEDVQAGVVRAKNFSGHAVMVPGDRFAAQALRLRDSAVSMVIGAWDVNAAIAGAGGKDISIDEISTDNISLGPEAGAVYHHDVDLRYMDGGSIGKIMMRHANGEAGGSAWHSGLTTIFCKGVDIGLVQWSEPLTTDLVHLPVTLVGMSGHVGAITVRGCAGSGIEFAGCDNLQIDSLDIDGEYLATSVSAINESVGINEHGFAHYPGQYRQGASPTRGVQIGKARMRRLGTGGLMSGVVSISDYEDEGIIGNGMSVLGLNPLPTTHFDTAVNMAMTRATLNVGSFASVGAGKRGLSFGEALGNITFGRVKIKNFGQNTAGSDQDRTGLYIGTSDNSGSLTIGNFVIEDDQAAISYTDGYSFMPGATDGNDRKWITLLNPTKFFVGQHVTLVNATGAGDAVGQIVDRYIDEVLVQFTGSVAFPETGGNLTTLTGTWTSDVDGRLINAVAASGNARAEIGGAYWLRVNPARYAQVARVPTANQIRLVAPFAAPLAGAQLFRVSNDITGIASSRRAIQAFTSGPRLFIPQGERINMPLADSHSDLSDLRNGSVYSRRATVTLSGTTVNLLTQIPAHHRLIDVKGNVDTAITGATWTDLRLTDSGGTVLKTLATALPLTLGSKFAGSGAEIPLLGTGNLIRATFSAVPAGAVTIEAQFRVDSGTGV